ncbi:nucleotide disphospho-sugar-binding domain-containing protein [Actinokineospora sp. NBRC 105648]|uniref:nucleotide disphospho-sugar-binding domain-containing protein n=1 Tax=Actinokineospora sp. NBRC 105648 TaxID=3032206 RepID=UPI0024A22E1A|nr:nucleotide disphospho-sugar-binding domain-containing protein [Actinokineospora sp. NBRC 105648]GLZ36624.1 glycosyl transferase [Actinokineospora sp. NBRC 105648]
MRVLLASVSVPSHLLPMVPLADALRAAGHEVLLACQPDLVPHAESAGLLTAVVGSEQLEADRRQRMARVAKQQAPGGTWQPTWEQLAERWRQRVAGVVDDYVEVGRWWRPDLIVADPLEFTARVLAGVLRVPVVVHRWGPETMSTDAVGPARAALADICARLGLPDGLPAPAAILDPCPPGLQFPAAAPSTAVRHVSFNGTGSVPDWARGQDRVCVSLGSMPAQLGGLALLETLARAELGGVELLVPLAEGLHKEVGDLPSSVRVVEPTPLNLFLDGCSAVVHHGGSGTALTALAHGLPQLVLPQFNPALAMCGERVAAVGAGVNLVAEDQLDPAGVGEALRVVLHEPGPRAGAGRMRDAMAEQPTPAELLPTLEALL